MSDPFAAPAAPGDGIKWGDVLGALVLVDVIGIKNGINTSFGVADAVQANIAVLDGDKAGEEYPDCLVFPKVLQSQLSSRIGQKVLGRVTQGQAKPGQSAPWMLSEATEQDKQLGLQWLSRTVAAPAAPQPQPAAQYPPPAAMGQQAPQQGAQWPPSGQQQPAAATGGNVPF